MNRYHFAAIATLSDARDYRVPPLPLRLIAAKLWADLLDTPGDNGVLMHRLLNASTVRGITNDKRREFARLLVLRGGDSCAVHPPWREGEPPSHHTLDKLDVDYGPGLWLAKLAEAADLGRVTWPMKTCGRFDYEGRYFSQANGYRAPHILHTPTPDGRVLLSDFNVYPLLDWLLSHEAAIGLPPVVRVAGWNWREYAGSIGIDPDSGADVRTIAVEEVRS